MLANNRERSVRAIESAIYAFEPNYVIKDVCVDCDKVPCSICGEKTPSALARGFVNGTQPSGKRYIPFGVEDGRWTEPPPRFNPTPVPGDDYSVTVKKALVDNLRYYCPKFVEEYGVAGLADAVYEKHGREHASSYSDDWYDD